MTRFIEKTRGNSSSKFFSAKSWVGVFRRGILLHIILCMGKGEIETWKRKKYFNSRMIFFFQNEVSNYTENTIFCAWKRPLDKKDVCMIPAWRVFGNESYKRLHFFLFSTHQKHESKFKTKRTNINEENRCRYIVKKKEKILLYFKYYDNYKLWITISVNQISRSINQHFTKLLVWIQFLLVIILNNSFLLHNKHNQIDK